MQELAQELVVSEEQEYTAAQVRHNRCPCICLEVCVLCSVRMLTHDTVYRRLTGRSRSGCAQRRRRPARSATPQGLCGRPTDGKRVVDCSAHVASSCP
jgi:hypothetical protein